MDWGVSRPLVLFIEWEVKIPAARPSMGKTDIILHFAKMSGWAGFLPLVFSLEMPEKHLLGVHSNLVEHDFLNNAKHIANMMKRRLEKELGVPVNKHLKMRFPGIS